MSSGEFEMGAAGLLLVDDLGWWELVHGQELLCVCVRACVRVYVIQSDL